jgi:hypothetical protein
MKAKEENKSCLQKRETTLPMATGESEGATTEGASDSLTPESITIECLMKDIEAARHMNTTEQPQIPTAFSNVVDLPHPLPTPTIRESTPGAHATAGIPGRRPWITETHDPALHEDTAAIEAEIAPDVESLEAENNALKAQLQRIQDNASTDSQQDVVFAEPIQVDRKSCVCRRRVWLGTCILLILLVTFLLIYHLRKDQEDTPPPIPQYDLTTPRFQTFRRMLVPLYGDTMWDHDPTRLRALHWVANEDLAQLDIETTPFFQLHERYIVALLYFSAGGWKWATRFDWLSSSPVCRWENVHCDHETIQHVQELNLAQHNLDGTIPEEIGNLEYLDRCDLSECSTSVFGNCTGITTVSTNHLFPTLSLGHNKLRGTIPTELGKLSIVGDLSLASNRLSGTLPSELGNLGRNLFSFSCGKFLSRYIFALS